MHAGWGPLSEVGRCFGVSVREAVPRRGHPSASCQGLREDNHEPHFRREVGEAAAYGREEEEAEEGFAGRRG